MTHIPGGTMSTTLDEARKRVELVAREAAVKEAAFEQRVREIAREEIAQLSRAPVGEDEQCTCHPDDKPPVPCARRYAYSECVAAPTTPVKDTGEGEAFRAKLAETLGRLMVTERERDEARSSLETAERRIGELTTPVTITEHDDQMDTFLAGVEGVIEATGCEQHDLWRDWHQREGLPWEAASSGLLTQVGTFGDMPVCISLTKVRIDGHLILFYRDTSLVVHNDIIRAWLKEHVPDTARRDGRLVHADAMNAINVMHTLRRAALTPDAGTARSAEAEEGE